MGSGDPLSPVDDEAIVLDLDQLGVVLREKPVADGRQRTQPELQRERGHRGTFDGRSERRLLFDAGV